MSKYKVAVYAISKNEEQFVDRWCDSVMEADEVIVLDTGSTDNTILKLKNRGVKVYSEVIDPWRFDVARNKSLDYVSDDIDICLCIDLDEVVSPGWRNILESNWDDSITRCRYDYVWSHDKDNKPLVNFYIDKIHSRYNYKWTHPVHEVLTYIGDKEEKYILLDNIRVDHYPDSNKSRSSYLPLLELSVKEDPLDDRNMHYLGREYMFYQMWDKCIETLKKHLSLKSATWKDERCASMRFIARSYYNLGNIELARIWYEKAINEAPYLKDGYVELGLLEYYLGNYSDACIYLEESLKIKGNRKSYINESFCNDNTVYDVLSICKYNLKDYKDSLYYVVMAYNMDKDNERIKNNKKLIEDMICITD